MISAYGNNKIKEIGYRRGISRFIDKPFLISDLITSIHEIADGRPKKKYNYTF
jgi:hypothetical protein